MVNISILVLVLAIGSVVGLTVKLGRNVKREGNLAYSKRVRLIFSGYLAVLIICMVVSTVLPVKGIIQLQKVNRDELDRESVALYDKAKAGDISQFDRTFLHKKWDFDVQGQQLKIAGNGENFYNITVMVERKGQNDGHIEAGFYMTRSEVDGLDISKLVAPPQLKLANGHLNVTNSPKNKLRLSQFTNVFSVKQFTGENPFGHESYTSEGQSILYMKIPKDLKLTAADNINLEYVDGA